jgi:hypothetical protein
MLWINFLINFWFLLFVIAVKNRIIKNKKNDHSADYGDETWRNNINSDAGLYLLLLWLIDSYFQLSVMAMDILNNLWIFSVQIFDFTHWQTGNLSFNICCLLLSALFWLIDIFITHRFDSDIDIRLQSSCSHRCCMFYTIIISPQILCHSVLFVLQITMEISCSLHDRHPFDIHQVLSTIQPRNWQHKWTWFSRVFQR